MLGGFGQTFLAVGDRANFAGQTDFAEDHQIRRHRARIETGNNRQQQWQVGACLGNAHPADHIHKHILILGRNSRMTVQRGQQHAHAVGV